MLLLGISINQGSQTFQNIIQTIITEENAKVASYPDQVRGCEHRATKKQFCAECGRDTWLPNPQKRIIDQKFIDSCGFESFVDDFENLKFEYDGDTGHWVVGKDVEELADNLTLLQQKLEICNNFNQTFNSQISPSQIGFHVPRSHYRDD
jgi:hypothetical protein